MHGLKIFLLSMISCGILCFPVYGQIRFAGNIKTYAVLYVFPGNQLPAFWNLPGQHEYGAVDQSVRLTVTDHITPEFLFETAYALSFRIQDPALFTSYLLSRPSDPFRYRVCNPDPLLYPKDKETAGSFNIFSNLDRLSITWSPEVWDLSLGRQVLAWGSARVINPTDVLAPFSFNTLDTEDRTGIDVLRLRLPVDRHDEIDLGYVFGKNWQFEESAFYLRTKFYWQNSDISVLMLGFRENALLGFDMARSVGGASIWIEGAQVWSGVFSKQHAPQKEKYFRLSSGIDYSLSPTLYGFIEYHYNGSGEPLAEEYGLNASKIAYTEGSVYLMARHYLSPGLVYLISPLTTLTFHSLWNLSDYSQYLALTIEYNMAGNIYLTGGAFISTGKEPADGTCHSEFGTYPDTFYTSLRIYL